MEKRFLQRRQSPAARVKAVRRLLNMVLAQCDAKQHAITYMCVVGEDKHKAHQDNIDKLCQKILDIVANDDANARTKRLGD